MLATKKGGWRVEVITLAYETYSVLSPRRSLQLENERKNIHFVSPYLCCCTLPPITKIKNRVVICSSTDYPITITGENLLCRKTCVTFWMWIKKYPLWSSWYQRLLELGWLWCGTSTEKYGIQGYGWQHCKER